MDGGWWVQKHEGRGRWGWVVPVRKSLTQGVGILVKESHLLVINGEWKEERAQINLAYIMPLIS